LFELCKDHSTCGLLHQPNVASHNIILVAEGEESTDSLLSTHPPNNHNFKNLLLLDPNALPKPPRIPYEEEEEEEPSPFKLFFNVLLWLVCSRSCPFPHP
jgi:hypothetical protein